MKRIVLVAIVLIVFFVAALGLAIASCVIPQWVSYTGTRLGVDPDTGNLTSYWYNVRTGLFRRCITEEGKEAENCWLHGDGKFNSVKGHITNNSSRVKFTVEKVIQLNGANSRNMGQADGA